MLDPKRDSRCFCRKCYHINRFSIVVLVLAIPLFESPAIAAQQVGAVPLAQGIADLASQLAKSVPEGHPMTVAVTDFRQKQQVCGLGQFVAERLNTLLSRQPQCRLIERHRLDQVLQELKFSMSELVDPAKARKLGEMLGAQGLVVGTITDLGTTFDVDARIIDIQTDVSLPGASASIINDETVRRLGADCGSTASKTAATGEGKGSAEPRSEKGPSPQVSAPATVASTVAKDFTFDLKSCTIQGAFINCALTITNHAADQNLFLYAYLRPEQKTRIIDDSGNEHLPEAIQLGNQAVTGTSSVSATLVSGIPISVRLTFEGVSASANRISLLEIICGNNRYYPFSAQLRKIPISKPQEQ